MLVPQALSDPAQSAVTVQESPCSSRSMRSSISALRRARSSSTNPSCLSSRLPSRYAVRSFRLLAVASPHPPRSPARASSRRHPRSVLRPVASVRVRRLPARSQLPLLGRLRGPWQAVTRDDLPPTGVQDQVPGELLRVAGEPRVCEYQPDLRVLRRMYVLHFRDSHRPILVSLILGCAALTRLCPHLPRCATAGKRRYNIKLWKTFTDCFNCLPIAAIIDEKIFTMHGGLSPDLQSMEQIRRVMRPTDVPDTGACHPSNP